LNVAPGPASLALNTPSALSGAPEVMVCSIWSWLVQATRVPSGTSSTFSRYWKVRISTAASPGEPMTPANETNAIHIALMLPPEVVSLSLTSSTPERMGWIGGWSQLVARCSLPVTRWLLGACGGGWVLAPGGGWLEAGRPWRYH